MTSVQRACALVLALSVGLLAHIGGLPFHLTGSNWSPLFAIWPLILAAAAIAWRADPERRRGVAEWVAVALGISAVAAGSIGFVAAGFAPDPGLAALFVPPLHAGSGRAAAFMGTVVLLLASATFIAAHYLGRARPRALRRAMILGAVICCVTVAGQWFLGAPTRVRPDLGASTPSVTGLAQDEHAYAAFLILSLGVLLGSATSFLRDKRRSAAVATGAVMVVGVVSLLLTNSRTGLLAFAASIVIMSGLCATTRGGRRLVLLFLIAGILVLGVAGRISQFGALPFPSWNGATRIMQLLEQPVATTIADASLQQRIALWRDAFGDGARNPFWGAGPGQFRVVREKELRDDPVGHGGHLVDSAHNYPLQIFAEFGAPTALLLLGLVGLCWAPGAYANLRGRAEALELAGILGAQAGVWIFSLASHPFLHPEFTVFYWATAGYCLARAEELREAEASGAPAD